jgi:hypothetical protein
MLRVPPKPLKRLEERRGKPNLVDRHRSLGALSPGQLLLVVPLELLGALVDFESGFLALAGGFAVRVGEGARVAAPAPGEAVEVDGGVVCDVGPGDSGGVDYVWHFCGCFWVFDGCVEVVLMCCGVLCIEMVGLSSWQLGLKEQKSVLEGWRGTFARERGLCEISKARSFLK